MYNYLGLPRGKSLGNGRKKSLQGQKKTPRNYDVDGWGSDTIGVGGKMYLVYAEKKRLLVDLAQAERSRCST